MSEITGIRIHITGIVQGVGFRPFVYGLAARLALTGWVRNTSAGVDIEADGTAKALKEFVYDLKKEAPPLAQIDTIHVENRPPNGFTAFEIIHSESISQAFQPISADVSICPDCLRELFDPNDRRHRYPFINCTNCGPRFTIIQDIPYDRPKTTMAGFPLCEACAAEYSDPLDRRFHAQPVACPVCGPKIWLEPGSNEEFNQEFSARYNASLTASDPIRDAQRLLAEGKILAIKGLGGFHLACDAADAAVVSELRRRKLRVDKPFALMMADIETIEKHCLVSDEERELLESRLRPIVILKRRPGSPIAAEVAPRQDTLGVMLPYTPLHYLLFKDCADGDHGADFQPLSVLVMTSGNLSEEPIAFDNDEARSRLAPLADAFLMHDRPIHVRCDDSVVRVLEMTTADGRTTEDEGENFRPSSSVVRPSAVVHRPSSVVLRRSRGYAPTPISLPFESPPLLAAGPELKNTFCLARDRYAFLSHHIGDLENYETLQSFETGIEHFERLFRILPEVIAYDLHPNYLATRYALERAMRENIPAIGVQHHHAHIAACMAEHGLAGDQPVIGVAFDGTGYGEDGAIWGGEFLIADYLGFQRFAHLAYTPLPGSDAAVRRPARTALAYLWQAGLEWELGLPSTEAFCAEDRAMLRSQLERGINAPLTSSMGRLFDAVAALAGVRQKVNYEAQAAIELEALVDPSDAGAYPFELRDGVSSQPNVIDPGPLIQAVALDVLSGAHVSSIAARFHNAVACMVLDVCRLSQVSSGIDRVVLSGGVWQNHVLLTKTIRLLEESGFKIYVPQLVPANDGGVSLGQAVVAGDQLRKG